MPLNTIEILVKYYQLQNKICMFDDWLEIEKYLLDKPTLDTGINTIKLLFHDKNITDKLVNNWARIINLLGIIATRPEWLCLPNENSYNLFVHVINNAKCLYTYINNLIEQNADNINTACNVDEIFNKFRHYTLKYLLSYYQWSQIDRNTQITKLIEHYLELDKTKNNVMHSEQLDDVQRKNVLDELNRQQQNITNYVDKIDGKMGIYTLDTCIKHLKLDTIRNICEIALWDSVIEEIIKYNTTTKLHNTLIDFRNLLISICNMDDCNALDELFDINFIINKISNNAESLNNILSIVDMLGLLLIKYDAPVNDIDNRNLINTSKTEINKLYIELNNIAKNTENITNITGKIDVSKKKIMELKQIVYAYGIILSNYYPRFEKIKEYLQELNNI